MNRVNGFPILNAEEPHLKLGTVKMVKMKKKREVKMDGKVKDATASDLSPKKGLPLTEYQCQFCMKLFEFPSWRAQHF